MTEDEDMSPVQLETEEKDTRTSLVCTFSPVGRGLCWRLQQRCKDSAAPWTRRVRFEYEVGTCLLSVFGPASSELSDEARQQVTAWTEEWRQEETGRSRTFRVKGGYVRREELCFWGCWIMSQFILFMYCLRVDVCLGVHIRRI